MSDRSFGEARVFVDSNVFLYARDDRFPVKQERAQLWLSVLSARDAAVVSPQVLGEIHNTLLRGKIQVTVDEVRRTTLVLETWSHGATDLELIASAWSLRGQTRFQWWDCVILGSAIRAGCSYLLSEDFQHGREVGGITIVDPFQAGPETIMTDH